MPHDVLVYIYRQPLPLLIDIERNLPIALVTTDTHGILSIKSHCRHHQIWHTVYRWRFAYIDIRVSMDVFGRRRKLRRRATILLPGQKLGTEASQCTLPMAISASIVVDYIAIAASIAR